MILIADSGSTKTDWAIVIGSTQPVVIKTQGINPVHQSREEIVKVLREEFVGVMGSTPEVQKLRSAAILTPEFPMAVYFYGSGVRPEMEPLMQSLLKETFPQASVIEAHSDLLGAARALCGRNEGIASILGTGANSCLYDGNAIVDHVPALGYILGDEGSAAVLGKRLVGDLLKNQLGDDLKEAFFAEYQTSMADIIEKVYRQPFPNRFLAKLSRFCADHIEDPRIHALVYDHFVQFIRRNLKQYDTQSPIGFVGSIAYYYRPILEEAMAAEGLPLGAIMQDPIEGLKEFHKSAIIPTTE